MNQAIAQSKTNKQKRNKLDKRQAVLDAALTLFVENGFHGTSTASIAKHAGVATGTLFHHFATKDAILTELFVTIKTRFASEITSKAALNGDFEHDANALWQQAIDWALANPLQQAFFLHFSLSSEIPSNTRNMAMHDILGFLVDMLKQGQQQGELCQYPIELMLENCHGQYLAAIRFFTDNPQLGIDPNHRNASFQLFWRAIKA
ncbi:TetR/AcrR family transcriptional regulator [Shewanella sp. WXL01]|uniref:TetR/AcrR family transcriptional regulator n=1 Tax=Shewanella maritima TaxID=2520507 RepID=A0A411PFT6_9GAMM|nr:MULTISPECIES: TetR/AcrR family transcriptional regulator [Shewanella]NKF49661.1 TetR/AcrR family transcriptional regulator [Shewanella sp. WXL01]QBF82250.1 TetR/AcrR family transcriptional regulator [Shewanella maritima]